MRKSFDSLCGLIREDLGRNPVDGCVYIFLNRRRTHLKLLHWESGGFVLYYKRLEQGQFHYPKKLNQSGFLLWSELVLMVSGIEIQMLRRSPRYVLKKE